jgi:hypothetical protein
MIMTRPAVTSRRQANALPRAVLPHLCAIADRNVTPGDGEPRVTFCVDDDSAVSSTRQRCLIRH